MGSAVAERLRNLDEEGNLLSRPIRFIYHVSFEETGAEEVILGPERGSAVGERDTLGGGSADLLDADQLPSLDECREQHLFRKMNFLFFRAEQLRKRAFFRGFDAGEREEVSRLVAEGQEIRNRLVEANRGLVLARAKRFLGREKNPADFISEGDFALIRAVGTFDFAHGSRFSTYACTALDRTFIRFVRCRQERSRTNDSEQDDPLAGVVDYRDAGPRRDAWREELPDQMAELLNQLGGRERRIIEKRYGLGGAEIPATLKTVASELGISVERVHQLEKKALSRLKELATQQGLEPFEE